MEVTHPLSFVGALVLGKMGEFSLYFMPYFLQYYHGSCIYKGRNSVAQGQRKEETNKSAYFCILAINSLKMMVRLEVLVARV